MANQAMALRDVELQLARQHCPLCREGHLDLTLRCSGESCLYVAHCDHCATDYDVDRDTFPSGTDPCENGRVHRATCPRCGSENCDVTFSCDPVSRRCVYETSCQRCAPAH